MTGVSDTAALAAIGAAARELKLATVRADAARLAKIAVRERQTHLAYLAELLSAEIDDRTGRRRTRRIAEARFPRIKRLADFNTDAIPGIAATLAGLAAGAWIDAGEPVVLLGDSGTGKTHLLIGLGLAACEQGRRVRYATTAQLVNELAEAADQRQLSRVVGRYGRPDLLLLDLARWLRGGPLIASASRCQYDGGARGPHSRRVRLRVARPCADTWRRRPWSRRQPPTTVRVRRC